MKTGLDSDQNAFITFIVRHKVHSNALGLVMSSLNRTMKSESRKSTEGDYLQLPWDTKVGNIAFQLTIPTPTVQREMKCILTRGML